MRLRVSMTFEHFWTESPGPGECADIALQLADHGIAEAVDDVLYDLVAS